MAKEESKAPMILQRPLRFGIKTSPLYATHEALLYIWREADALPIFEHAWVFDHFMPLGDNPTGPCLEGWTLLAALTIQTQRLRVGVMVTSNTYRHPAVLAKMATTIDIITHDRLNFAIGAGSSEQEHRVQGIPLYSSGERIRRLAEACELIRQLWTEAMVSFEGHYYQLHEAHCERGKQDTICCHRLEGLFALESNALRLKEFLYVKRFPSCSGRPSEPLV
jgi:alkanesulfonate monooxygenase SsuD/methylene tetrahydromethanopterin reductase-like flavin-dependent oxidoreductase (luciferase family)